MPRVLKRRAEAEVSPEPPTQRRRSASASENAESDNNEDGKGGDDAGTSHEQMVKNLVRLALASEFSRQPLRRTDISAKVLGSHSRAFKSVFKAAQDVLHQTFGMTLVELPSKEKHTIQQKRAAQRSGNANANSQSASSSNSYVLTSTLPPRFRKIPILAPTKNPSFDAESGYTGFYTFVVTVILLTTGQRISESKLLRHLQKVNADDVSIEGEKTEKILKRMEREGYIVKIRERDSVGGEENVDWVVGPRGKVEIGEKGAAGLVKTAYGKVGVEMDELEDRMEKSLGVGTFKRRTRREDDNTEMANAEENGENGEAEAEAAEETATPRSNAVRARPTPSYRGTARPSHGTSTARDQAGARTMNRRSARSSNGLVIDEAEREDDDADEEDDDGDEQEDDSEEEDE